MTTQPTSGTVQAEQWQQRVTKFRAAGTTEKIGTRNAARGATRKGRYLRRRGGFCLGYTAEVAVSDDHLIVAQRVHQATTDTGR